MAQTYVKDSTGQWVPWAGSDSASQPATNFVAVTPNNSTDLAAPTRGLYVGGAGNVSVDDFNSHTSIVFAGVAAGTVLPIVVKRVRATGTTASDIVALF